MSFLESAIISSSLNWTQKDSSRGDTIILDNGAIKYNYLFASGSDVGQVNTIWTTTGTLDVGEQRQFDLFALQRSMFGGIITTNFNGGSIKGIIIENLNTGLNQNLVFNTSGANAFSSPFQTGNVSINISPESAFVLGNKFGYPVSTGQRYFYLKDINYSGGTLYEIAIVGVSP